jgi:Ku protein
MASPRSSWTGTFVLGLLNVPVSLAPAVSEEREKSLKELCNCHKKPIDGSHRCSVTMEPPEGKVKGVEDAQGNWRVLSEADLDGIESATASKEITFEEAQSSKNLPIEYATKTYFVRAEKDNRAAAQGYKTLLQGLLKSKLALVAKWGSRNRERLIVVEPSADKQMLLLRTLPMKHELRTPGDQELAHQNAEVPKQAIEMAANLIEQFQTPEFLYESYTDEGLNLRQKAVDKILAGEAIEVPEEKQEDVPDIMAQLEASMAAASKK